MYEPRSRALSYVRLSHPIVRLWPRAADFSIGPAQPRRQPLTRTSDRLADGAWRTAPFQRCIVPYQSRSRRPVPLQIIARKRVDLGESESSHQPRSPMVVQACIENDGKEDEECQPKLWPPSASEKRVPRH